MLKSRRIQLQTQLQKCEVLAELHGADSAWIVPNPWDVGSALILEGLGFKALATTSSGFAATLGRVDGQVSLEEKLEHCTALCAATTIPISADFENGYAESLTTLQENILRLAGTGVAGFSIEDYSREHHALYDFSEAVDRVSAAVEAVTSLDLPLQITARAENLLRGSDDLDDTLKRLQAFSAAGAHVLYAPGLRSTEQLCAITSAVDRPVNVLASFMPAVSVGEYSKAGATRISLGGALSQAAISPLLNAGREMLEQGSFDWLASRADGAEINALLTKKT